MQKKITLFSIFILTLLWTILVSANTRNNQVVGIKALPLPDDRVRLIFQFSSPLKQKPPVLR